MKSLIRVGISVVILAIFSVVAAKIFTGHPELLERRKVIAGCFAGAGALLFFVSKVHGGGSDDFKRADRLFTARFCASLLGGFGAVITNIAHIQETINAAPRAMLQATRDHAPAPKLAEASDSTPTRESAQESSRGEPGNFKVQGIIFKANDPSAIVNGKTVFVGDRVGHAKVIAIEREAVTLETARQKVVLAFRM